MEVAPPDISSNCSLVWISLICARRSPSRFLIVAAIISRALAETCHVIASARFRSSDTVQKMADNCWRTGHENDGHSNYWEIYVQLSR